ncbi:hypothetical protein [Roseiconus lacunae]|uniref:hypothetical protein n=1 Tax=Roseiconus lacunae TaxID=2605694 RepID=UPI001E2931ED|nr:hypothetical protein [Roseiconus lacunae]MCD0459378.1 hypothetical protein [Roseiconus lacunae]WRQ53903.1 hypothetical protein U8335_28385 [Stieleria sp. HD01]
MAHSALADAVGLGSFGKAATTSDLAKNFERAKLQNEPPLEKLILNLPDIKPGESGM